MSNYRNVQAMGPRTRRFLAVLLTFIALVAAACGSDATETAEPVDPAAETKTDAEEPEPKASEPDPDPEDLLGTWSTPAGLTWQIEANSMVSTIPGLGIVESSYSATGTKYEITDVSGEFACAPNHVGNYEWAIVDDVLTVTLISDECEGRGAAVDGQQFTRQESEPEESASEASPEDLIGTWTDPGGITWEIEADSIMITGGVDAEASYSATSTTFEFWADVCGLDVVGKYGWEIVDDVLTLSLISDSCEGRGLAFDGKRWTRQ